MPIFHNKLFVAPCSPSVVNRTYYWALGRSVIALLELDFRVKTISLEDNGNVFLFIILCGHISCVVTESYLQPSKVGVFPYFEAV